MRRLRHGIPVLLAAAVAAPAGGRSGGVRELLHEGERLWAAGVYEPARAQLERAHELARQQGDDALEARAINLLANVADSQGDWERALGQHEQALSMARSLEDRPLEARILVDTGVGHWRRAEYAEAQSRCGDALALWEESQDLTGQGDAHTCLGRISFKRGEHERALEHHGLALALFQAGRDVRGQAIAAEDLGQAFRDRHAYAQALDHFQRSLVLMERAGDAAGRCRVLGDIGYLYLVQGADSEAQRYFHAALEVARDAHDQGGLASALSKLGGVHARRGQSARALEHYAASLRIRREIGDRREVAWTLARMGAVHGRAGRYDEALPHYLQALDIWEQIRDRRAPGWYLGEVGRAYEHLGDAGQALAFYERSLALALEIRLPTASLTLGRMARLHARAGRPAEALARAREAVERADATGNADLRWTARFDLAQVQLTQGLRDEALLHLRESLDLIEGLRAEVVASDEAKAGWLHDRQDVYAAMVAVLMERGQAAEALEVAERGRGRAFLDLLARAASAPESTGLDRPEVASPMHVPPLDLAALREQARRSGSTLVEYFTAADRIFIWVLSPTGEIHAATSPMSAGELDRLVDELRRTLGADAAARAWDGEERAADQEVLGPLPPPSAPPDEAGGDARPALRRLHRLLVEPVREWLPRDPEQLVTLVPHGKIFLVSFAALLDGQDRYLVERHTLNYSPAISTLSHTGRRAPDAGPRRTRVLVVGNPTMPTLPGRRRPLRPLPGAEGEARAIGALFPADHVTTLLGPRAVEWRVRALAPQHTILHLATHGVVRDDSPLDSLLALAPSASRAPEGDGLWTAREVFALDLQADLVTLSACNTGLGRVTGDGVFGLSRAFLSAGTSSLVVSLWRVADSAARRQMERFYREIGREPGAKAAALRRAQLGTIRDLRQGRVRVRSGRPLPEDPTYWAPFVLIGEGRREPTEPTGESDSRAGRFRPRFPRRRPGE